MVRQTAPIHVEYEPLYKTKKRYILITGGRGSLKSTTVHDFIARLTYQSGHGILFTRYTMAAADISIIPEFRETLIRLGIEKDFKITNTRAINKKTGSFILFSGIKTSGGDQSGRLKSIAGITTWVIEEGEDFNDEKVFDKIDDSIRTTARQNRVIWIQNPTTKEHFIYKRWIKNTSRQVKVEGFDVTVSDHPQVEHIHTTYHIAEELGYLAPDWLAKAADNLQKAKDKANRFRRRFVGTREAMANGIRAIMQSSYYYYNYIGGWLERAEGAIFDNWIEGDFDDSLPFIYGLDYGYSPDPLAMVKVAVDKKKKRIYVDEIIYETLLDDVAEEFRRLDISKRTLIVADVNEKRTSAILKDRKRGNGWNMANAKKGAGSIAHDIREIRKYTIVVTKRSANVKAELNNWIWNDKKSSLPIDDFNHAMDALRYAFARLTAKKQQGARRKNPKR